MSQTSVDMILRLITTSMLLIALNVSAQVSRLGQKLVFMAETSGTMSSNDTAPFWLSANRWGLASTEKTSGYMRGSISRPLSADSLRRWKVGYGADLVVAANHPSTFHVHQLYAAIQHSGVLLTAGARETDHEFNNPSLSLGNMTLGRNARPIPQIRVETADYLPLHFTHDWVSLKGMISYGWYTDGGWQKDFVSATGIRSNHSLFHAKSLYIKIGNKAKSPLSFTGGIEFATQFGGEAWNLSKRDDDMSDTELGHVKLNNGLRGYWNAFTFGGNDPNDGDFTNMEGNHVGSWLGSVEYKTGTWSVRTYFEHFFDDHSQLFWQYGWKDMTWGIEAHLPANPFVSTIVAEHLSTRDQTGALYHDATPNLPVQISGSDNYYNHHIYGSWQHWGMTMGNPLLLSPIYNENRQLTITHNRINATHIGIMGNPHPTISYRLLCTWMRSWGNYWMPPVETLHDNFMLAEVSYTPQFLDGYTVTGDVGVNNGNLMNDCIGFTLTLRKTLHGK